MKHHGKKLTVFLCISAVIVCVAIVRKCRSIYRSKIGTEEALDGKDCAPFETIVAARNFIAEKYGIRVLTVSSLRNYEWEGFDFIIPHKKYDGTCSIEMMYGETQFEVFVDAGGSITDNYQTPELQDSLQAYLADLIPECEITVDLEATLWSDHIDPSDMDTFLQEYGASVIVYTVQKDLDDSRFDAFKDLARQSEARFTLVSCRTEQDIATLAALHAPTYDDPTYAMQAESVWYYRYNGKTEAYEENTAVYQLGQYGDLWYTLPETAEVRIMELDLTEYTKDTYDDPHRLLTPAYRIRCDETVTVFYPADDADAEGMKYYERFKNILRNKEADKVGGYYAVTFYSEQWHEDQHMSYYYTDDKPFGIYIDNVY